MDTNQQQSQQESRRKKIGILIALIALLAPLTWYAVHQHGRSRAHPGSYGRMARSTYPTPGVTPPVAQQVQPEPIAAPPPEVHETLVPPPAPMVTVPRKVAVRHHHRVITPVVETPEVLTKPEVALIPEAEKTPTVEATKPSLRESNVPPAVVATPAPRTGIEFSRSMEAPRLTINQTNLLDTEFHLVRTNYWLNGVLVEFSTDSRASAVEARTVTAVEGANVLRIQAVANGLEDVPVLMPFGFEFVPHSVAFVVDNQKTFIAHAGDKIVIDSVLFEDGDRSKMMNERMHLNASVSGTEPDGVPLAER